MLYLLFPNIFSIFVIFFNNSNVKFEETSRDVHYMGFSKLENKSEYIDMSQIFDKVDSNLVKKFNNIQSEFGRPLKVVWGYRDVSTNRKIGGARNSAHLYGKALDIVLDTASKEDVKRLIKIASSNGILGIGVYRDSKTIHIDIDEKKGRRVWGSNYSSSSIPRWAIAEVREHLNFNDAINHTINNSVDTLVSKNIIKDSKPKCSIKSNIKNNSTIDSSKVKSTEPVYHIMRSGDTIYSLAKNNNTTVKEVCRLSKISDTSKIKIGQKIRIK